MCEAVAGYGVRGRVRRPGALSIGSVLAEVLPEDKVAEVARLQAAGASMAFSSVSVVSNSLRLRRFGR